MWTTIDKAGRLVIPKPLRDRVGLAPGAVDLTVDGTAIRIEAVAGAAIDEREGRPVIPASGATIDDDLVRALRDADQR